MPTYGPSTNCGRKSNSRIQFSALLYLADHEHAFHAYGESVHAKNGVHNYTSLP